MNNIRDTYQVMFTAYPDVVNVNQLKDTTKNQSSYRTLPLVDEIISLLSKHKKQIDINRNSYNKKYLNYICVDSIGKLFRPEYVTDHFSLIMKNNKTANIYSHLEKNKKINLQMYLHLQIVIWLGW